MAQTEPKKKYQVWDNCGSDGWTLTEFDTLEEALASNKYSQWMLTKRVNMKITELEEL